MRRCNKSIYFYYAGILLFICLIFLTDVSVGVKILSIIAFLLITLGAYKAGHFIYHIGFGIGYDLGYLNGERRNGYSPLNAIWKEYDNKQHFIGKLLEEEGKKDE